MNQTELMGLFSTVKSNEGPSFEERLEASVKNIQDSASKSKVVNDHYGNSLLSVGTDDKVESFSKYTFSNDTLNWPLWMALYNDSWVFKRAIDKPAQDQIRCGITLQGEAEFDKIYKDLKYFRNDFINLLQWGALFGGSIAVIMIDNMKDEEYAKAINIEKLKKSRTMRMYVTDRWYGVAPSSKTVTNMNDIDFGKPSSYDVSFPDGQRLTFHHSWVLRYEHRTAPKLVKSGMLQGWGYAEGSHIIGELSRDEKLKTSIQSLVDKALIEVIKMSGMRGVFMGADQDNENQLRRRLEMVNWGRSFNSLTFLDKDDDYQEHGFSGLSGLSDLLEKNMWLISSALEMQGILFGDLKGGFSSDELALERYDETINNRCEAYLRPVYQKFLGILYKKYDIKIKPEFEFNSLLTKQQDEDKMNALKAYAELLSTFMNDGVLTLQQYAKAIQQYISKGIIDIPMTDEDIDKLQDKMQEELENIDINAQ